jgi:hypothetical protein
MSSDKIPEGKYSLELNIVHPKAIFINFWDHIHGNDVVVEVELENGRLWITREGEELPSNISLREYLTLVIESIQKRTI